MVTPNQLLMNASNIIVPVKSEPSNYEKNLGFVNSQFARCKSPCKGWCFFVQEKIFMPRPLNMNMMNK